MYTTHLSYNVSLVVVFRSRVVLFQVRVLVLRVHTAIYTYTQDESEKRGRPVGSRERPVAVRVARAGAESRNKKD